MLGITYRTAAEHNLIRFPHANDPIDLFFLESGNDIIIHDSYDHKHHRVTCTGIPGEHSHFYDGNGHCYHINEFSERMKKNGHSYEPAEPIEDLKLFAPKYLDREPADGNNKAIPYRMIWCNNTSYLYSNSWFDRKMPEPDRLAICICPDAAPDRKACLVDGSSHKEFLSLNDLRSRLDHISMEPYERRQVQHSALQAERQHPMKTKNSFRDLLHGALMRASEAHSDHSRSAPVQTLGR